MTHLVNLDTLCHKSHRACRASPRQALLTMHRMQTMQGKTRLSRRCAKTVQRPCKWRIKGKSHEESYDSSWDFGALEGTRIPGPLIKSQMLYRLSYERIHYKAQYNTILPNNITILPGKMQAFCTKNFPKAVIGQILPRTAPLQTGQEPVQSKQFITKLQPTCRAHFRAGQADPIGD